MQGARQRISIKCTKEHEEKLAQMLFTRQGNLVFSGYSSVRMGVYFDFTAEYNMIDECTLCLYYESTWWDYLHSVSL